MKAYKCWVLKNVLRAGRRSLVAFQKKNKRYDFSVNLCHILVLCIAVLVLKWLATIFFGFFSLYLTKQIQADKSTHAECLNSSVRFVSGKECFSILTLPLNANDDGKNHYIVFYIKNSKNKSQPFCVIKMAIIHWTSILSSHLFAKIIFSLSWWGEGRKNYQQWFAIKENTWKKKHDSCFASFGETKTTS